MLKNLEKKNILLGLYQFHVYSLCLIDAILLNKNPKYYFGFFYLLKSILMIE